jgi:hypothetical protein
MFEVGKTYSVTMADGTTYYGCEVVAVDGPLVKFRGLALADGDHEKETILNTGSREFVAAQPGGKLGALNISELSSLE